MDIDLTQDQELLLETSLHFIESAYPLTTVRDEAGGGAGPASSYLERAGDLGWFSLLVPEHLGGGSVSGCGVVDCAVVASARGRWLQPGSFVGTNVAAYALATQGSPEQQAKILPQLMSGTETATWAHTAPGDDGWPTAGVKATRRGNSYVITGTKTLVQDPDRASWILLSADTDDGAAQFLLPGGADGVLAEAKVSMDVTRRFGRVVFADAEIPASAAVGEPGRAGPFIEREVDIASVLTAAESVGAMDRDFQTALDYAKDRIAFGRPIGSFQAIKHLLADTSLLLEMSKAMTMAASRAVGTGAPDAAAVASMAKAFVGDCSIELAQNCFQVFGGIGFTWEHDQHLYLRRLTTDAALYGSPSWHRERLCRLGGL